MKMTLFAGYVAAMSVLLRTTANQEQMLIVEIAFTWYLCERLPTMLAKNVSAALSLMMHFGHFFGSLFAGQRGQQSAVRTSVTSFRAALALSETLEVGWHDSVPERRLIKNFLARTEMRMQTEAGCEWVGENVRASWRRRQRGRLR